MAYHGIDLKFRMTSTFPVFDFDEHDFRLTVKDRYGRVIQDIPKDECFTDSEGNWYFTVENIRCKGAVFVRFQGEIPDEDFDGLVRHIADAQILYFVGRCSCGLPSHCQREHNIQYEQVWTQDLDGSTYLTDEAGNLILTADGRRIQITQP